MKIALVTGSNKGIGREIVQLLSSPPHSIKTIIACRNRDLGEMAAKELQAKGCDVVFHQLDLTDQESIRNTCDFISSEFGHLDVLVNNAAVCFNDPTLYGKCVYTPFEKQARISMETNFFGTLKVTQTMLPLLRKSESPRVINIASSAGRLAQLSKSPERTKLVTSPNLKLEHLVSLMNEFVDDVEAGVHQQKGWPNTCYGMSKVGIIALSRMFAR
jgi:carbonyl reductase 1